MQEMQHPTNGDVLREFFTDAELKAGKMAQRRKELEAEGYTFGRVAYIMKQTKYQPNQGAGEAARRLRQMQRNEANRAKRLAMA